MQADQVEKITYEGVDFDIDNDFTVCTHVPGEDENTKVLSTYTDSNGEEAPLSILTNDKHVRVGHQIPSFYGISTYALSFLDAFHSAFGAHDESAQKYALLRLEDVNPYTYEDTRELSDVYRYLQSKGIPFHLALIPRYINPEKGIDMLADAAPRYLNLIRQMIANEDAIVVQHGYTHQVGDEISGSGYEFWDAEANAPLHQGADEEARAYANTIVDSAQAEMARVGLPVTDIWETPHYALGAVHNDAINERYPVRYERIQKIGALPFVAEVNGSTFIPENLGFIDSETDLNNISAQLEQLGVFDDAVASVFWHPWRDSAELVTLVETIEANGYTFVSAHDLISDDSDSGPQPQAAVVGSVKNIWVTDILLYLALIAFTIAAIIYARNVRRIRKHYKYVKNFAVPMEDVQAAANEFHTEIPKLAVFVPARNEGMVIENTLRKINEVEYPRDRLSIFVITDEREHDDDVEDMTKDVAEKTAQELNGTAGTEFIKVIEVPHWYSGVYGSNEKTFSHSTKGRALNYCLQLLNDSDIDMIGILDADGRMHRDVLKEVAKKRIVQKSKVLQGPVLQVNNFKNVTIVGVAAALELAMHYLTELPEHLKREGKLQFFAGTNYFIDLNCIKHARGWDQHALVEDAELALRLYMEEGVVGDWLDAPEVEQTPQNFKIYRKQRERWARGHLDLLPRIRKSSLSFKEKIHFYNKILFAQFRFVWDFGLLVISWFLLFAGAHQYVDQFWTYWAILVLIASVFIWDTYGFIYRTVADYINPNMTSHHKIWQSIKLFFFLPFFMIAQAIPRLQALFNKTFRPHRSSWYKTERTHEESHA